MGQFRTLTRKLKVDQDRRAARKTIKPGTRRRHIIAEYRVGQFEVSFHATKGARVKRVDL